MSKTNLPGDCNRIIAGSACLEQIKAEALRKRGHPGKLVAAIFHPRHCSGAAFGLSVRSALMGLYT